jgi:hypothetical protein
MITSILDSLNIAEELQDISKTGLSGPTALCDLMCSFGSDKGNGWHNYTVAYDHMFSRFRREKITLFELGIGTTNLNLPASMGASGKPGASLRAWRSYFPYASIYGADIDHDVIFQEERIQTFWVDQTDPYAINSLWNKLGGVSFDIMIDDGFHDAKANINFLLGALHKLKPGGVYIVEDILEHNLAPMSALAEIVKYTSRNVILQELDNTRNHIDNRLMILQKS